jgi:hypothetical protein
MELRLQIPDAVVQQIQEKLGSTVKGTDIARDAITLFKWAVDETAKGRYILSANEEGRDVTRLAMPSLDNVQQQAKPASVAFASR